jgi:hypothetical protein
MSATILLLYAKSTGHVLAAATVAAPPDGEVKPEALAGQALPMQYVGNPNALSPATALASVPADQLAVLSVDSLTVPIEQARTYFIKPDNTPSMLDPLNTVTCIVATTRDAIDVHFVVVPTVETNLSVRIGWIGPPPGPSNPVQAIDKKLTLPITSPVHIPLQTLPPSPADTYSALVLMQGFVPLLSTI